MSLVQGALSVVSFSLSHLYLPASCTWIISRYVIKAPPITFAAEVILSLVTMGLLLPVIISILSLNLLVRTCLSIYLRLVHGSKVFLMSGRDSFVSHDEFANSCNHYSLYVIKGKCDLGKIRRKFSRILEEKAPDGEVVYDRMKRRLVTKLGYYSWEHMGETFDINQHVKYLRPELDPQSVLTEGTIFEELRNLYDYPFKGDKPQWEILVIPNFKYDSEVNNNNSSGASIEVTNLNSVAGGSGGGNGENLGLFTSQFESDSECSNNHYGFIVRMHHCIMDGISAGNALQHYMADAPMKLTVDPLCPSHALPLYKTLLAYLQILVLGPRAFLKVLFLDETNCFHGPQLSGPKTLSWSKQVNVEALKKVKECTKTSVTAVLVSALGGSVRNLAMKKGLPVPSQVHAFPTIGILPFPDIKPRNRFTMALLPLCIGLDTGLERLKSAQKSLKNLLQSPDVLTNYHLMQVFGVLPVRVINFFLEKCHATLLLSNVPGPSEKATIFGGDQIVDIGIWAPIQLGIGIGMSLFSYGGIVRATVVVDKTACPHQSDVPTIIEEFEKEVISLAKYANVPVEEVFNNET